MSYPLLVIVGAPKCGKSSLHIRYIQNQFVDEYDPTIEDSYIPQRTIDGNVIPFRVLDSYDTVQNGRNFQDAHGYIVAYAINDRASFEAVPSFIQKVNEQKKMEHYPPLILAACKVDLSDERVITREEGDQLARSYSIQFFECSAKDAVSVEQLFETLLRLTVEQMGFLKQNNTSGKGGKAKCDIQ